MLMVVEGVDTRLNGTDRRKFVRKNVVNGTT